VFSHGLSGHPDKFTQLFRAWATEGYVVVAPAFPSTNGHVPGSGRQAGDVVQQPADVSFVLTQTLRLARDPKSRLYRAVDRRHIGAAGMSLGGLTTYAVVFDSCCRDDRFTAAMVLDGIAVPLNGGSIRLDGHVPLLIAHSDADPLLPYGHARATYSGAAPPVWLITLHGAGHSSQWEDAATPYDALANRTTVDFWDATLGGDTRAFARLQRDATVAGMSSIEVRPKTS
jgi:dienelactone hydrolase